MEIFIYLFRGVKGLVTSPVKIFFPFLGKRKPHVLFFSCSSSPSVTSIPRSLSSPAVLSQVPLSTRPAGRLQRAPLSLPCHTSALL